MQRLQRLASIAPIILFALGHRRQTVALSIKPSSAACCAPTRRSAEIITSTASTTDDDPRKLINSSISSSSNNNHNWPPSDPSFFEKQLELCRSIVAEEDDGDNTTWQQQHQQPTNNNQRTRFKEHPRCTARFGEALLHSRNYAASLDEYQKTIYNARSVLRFVGDDTTDNNDGNIDIIGNQERILQLANHLATSLSSRSVINFRKRQLKVDDFDDIASKSAADFTPEQSDLDILGRLYYSAVRAAEPLLEEVGLTPDHGGFTVFLALCRAASAANVAAATNTAATPEELFNQQQKHASAIGSDDHSNNYYLSNQGLKLDAALSCHFNGIAVPGCRFLFSPRHGISPKKQGQTRKRANHLIIAFSSLGNGLVRHEFGGSLAKINQRLLPAATDDNGTGAETDDQSFDVLFIADPSQSWYQKDSTGTFQGFYEYQQRILLASKPYRQISMIGDSMGGSASLLFSHLATECVIGFSPQVDIRMDNMHVSRDDMTPLVRERFYSRLVESVKIAAAKGVRLVVHRGVEEGDVEHTDQLLKALVECRSSGDGEKSYGNCDSNTIMDKVTIVEHEKCKHHQVAVYLKEKGTLLDDISNSLFTLATASKND